VIATIDRITGGSGIDPPGRPTLPADPPAPGSPQQGPPPAAASFAATLDAVARDHSVTVSGHAQHRLEQRRIDLHDDQLERLGRAMDTLAARGGRRALVMLDQVAYVVHVASHTVVTAVGPDQRKEAVFTQIDSVAIA
jgi:flagellar operon protein